MNTFKNLIKQLNYLRAVEPNSVFVKTSRSIILGAKPTKTYSYFGLPSWLLMSVAAVFVLVITISVYSFSSPKPALSASFNPANLEREFKELAINIELQELTYRQTVNQTIVSALNEIQNTSVSHLNKGLLEEETRGIELIESANPRIDELLDRVLL